MRIHTEQQRTSVFAHGQYLECIPVGRSAKYSPNLGGCSFPLHGLIGASLSIRYHLVIRLEVNIQQYEPEWVDDQSGKTTVIARTGGRVSRAGSWTHQYA